ncbi:MAG: 30S ribosomal protein S7 [Candidatus Margulisiibacteriota bacterium]
MARKSRSIKREITPDPVYNSVNLAKFINKLMISGKKSIAQGIVYGALQTFSEKVGEQPVLGFEKVIKNVMPIMEVKSRRVGGSTYQVPVEVKMDRAVGLAMRWLIQHSRSRSGKSMADKLANEFVDAYNKVGASIKKREETHKMAEANKAFAHFRW